MLNSQSKSLLHVSFPVGPVSSVTSVHCSSEWQHCRSEPLLQHTGLLEEQKSVALHSRFALLAWKAAACIEVHNYNINMYAAIDWVATHLPKKITKKTAKSMRWRIYTAFMPCTCISWSYAPARTVVVHNTCDACVYRRLQYVYHCYTSYTTEMLGTL